MKGCLPGTAWEVWKTQLVSWKTEQRHRANQRMPVCVYYYVINNHVCYVSHVPGAVVCFININSFNHYISATK